MPGNNDEEKTESATPRRRMEARERGHVAKSTDLANAIVLLSAVIALWFFGAGLMDAVKTIMRNVFQGMANWDGSMSDIMPMALAGLVIISKAMAPILVTIVLFALAAHLLQIGFLVSNEALKPDLNKLNPISGIARIVSLKGFVKLIASIAKVLFVGLVLGLTIYYEWDTLMILAEVELDQAVGYMVELAFLVALRAALALLLLAIIDYAYQKWQYEKDLMMSKQEVKDEMKRMEGDPKIKSHRRQVQLQMAIQRMMQNVPKATVVITNPTHFSVALQYDQDTMPAPRVVAKGQDHLAFRIRDLARENNVPVVERPPLARALFRSTEVGDEIPEDLYQAVAEVLAYVFELNDKMSAA
jgi:flagellar biosynthetic protein FlhB